MKLFSLVPSFLFFFVVFSSTGYTQPIPLFDKTPRVVVRGEGVVTLPADRARLEIGVVTEAKSAKSAAARNSKKLQPTLKNLSKILGKKGEIKTIGYVVTPKYQFSKTSGPSKISGYSASSTVLVVSDDLKVIGKLIDEAAQSGANRIRKLEFVLRDEDKARLHALTLAAKKAKAKAGALAGALGLRVIKVISIEEAGAGGGVVRSQISAFAGKGTPTPIEPGSVEVKASVTLTVEIGK